jgi:ADP-heptose:LPS heptosyltransferase
MINWKNVHNIALLRRDRLGDLLCCQPLLRYCLREAPHASVTLFGDRGQRELLPYLPEIDHFVELPMRYSQFAAGYGMARRHRGKFDLAFSGRVWPLTWGNLFLHGLGATYRAAHVDKRWYRFLINKPHWWDNQYQTRHHQAVKVLHLVDPELNNVPEALQPSIHIPDRMRDTHQPDLNFGNKEPLLLVSISNNRASSLLDPARVAQAINQLPSIRIVISGVPQDAPRAAILASHLRVPHRIILTETLDALLVLVDSVDGLFIGDGGLMHFAAALKKPQLVLFGKTLPSEWHPLSNKARWLSHPIDVNGIPQPTIEEALRKLWT